jgi:hypothetical protein
MLQLMSGADLLDVLASSGLSLIVHSEEEDKPEDEKSSEGTSSDAGQGSAKHAHAGC